MTAARETILLTGGAGFIGTSIATRLAEHHDVRLFDTLHRDAWTGSPLADHPAVTLVRGDVRDRDAMREAVRGVDRVIHLASIAGVSTVIARPELTLRVALDGASNLLDAAREEGGIKRLVFFSTSEVFGPMAFDARESEATPVGPIGEPRWTYAVAKLAVEHLAHAAHREHGLPIVCLRPFNVYGPAQIGEGAIHNFVRRAVSGQPLVVHNDGAQIRAWCFVDDMVEGTLRATFRDEAVGHTFNIGNPRATVTVLRLAELVAAMTGGTARIEHVRRDYPDVQVRVPNIDKARALLDWEPAVSLEAGLSRTIEGLRARIA